MKKLGIVLLELFSLALGLKAEHLKEMGCLEGMTVQGHYYPACPEPELAIGSTSHTDIGFFTILLQDNLGGLHILRDNHWVDIHPVPAALLVNIADFFQLITNDRFMIVVHRVVAQGVGPRVSMACFFRTHFQSNHVQECRLYGPIKELLSDENPPLYKDISMIEYLSHFHGKGRDVLDGTSPLLRFKI